MPIDDVTKMSFASISNGCAIACEQLLRDPAQYRRIVEVLDDHHELVAAQPRQQVGLPQGAGERGRHPLQQLIADAMAERVVDVLEPVEVDEQHADAMSAALGLRDRLRQALVQQQPVGQAGQRVAGREVLQSFLGLDPRRDVLHERQDRNDLACVVQQRRVVPLAPDRVAVAAVIAGEAGRPRLFAAHEPPHQTREGLAVFFVHERAVGERNPQDFVRAPAEDVLRLRRPANEPEVAVPLEHRQRRIADVRRQHPVHALQFVFVAFLVVDIRVHRVDADHVALGIAIRRKVNRFPALLAVRLRELLFGRHRFAGEHAIEQRPQLVRALVADHVGDLPPRELLPALAQPFLVVPIEEAVAIVAVDVRHPRRHVVHDEAQLRLRRAQRLLRLLQAVDVVHQHERAVHFAGGRGIGHHANRHPAPHAVRARHQPVEGRGFALHRARQHRLRALVDAVPDDVAQPHLVDLLRRQPEELQERAVHVMAALVAIDIRHRRRHAVHDRAQLAFARGQRVLHLLEIGDVVADDVLALDGSVVAHVGHAPRPQPAFAAAGVDDRALVGDGFAADQYAIAIRLQRAGKIRCHDFGGGLADDLVALQTDEPQECVVDEFVTAVRAQIDDRFRNVVVEQAQLLLARASACSVSFKS